MGKTRIKLTESHIDNIIRESLNDILAEIYTDAKIRQSTDSDYWNICKITSQIEGAPSPETIDSWFVEEGGLNNSMSFVAENLNGEMVGVCVCSNGTIDDESPDMKDVQPKLYDKLNKFKYVMGLGFFIKKEYRGGNLHRNMMNSILRNAQKLRYDFVIIPVYRHLKTHNMYLHIGCIPFHVSTEDVIYYLYPINKEIINVVRNNTTQSEVKSKLLHL